MIIKPFKEGDLVWFRYKGKKYRHGFIKKMIGTSVYIEHPDGAKYSIERQDLCGMEKKVSWPGIYDGLLENSENLKIIADGLKALAKIASPQQLKLIAELIKPVNYFIKERKNDC